MNNESQFVVAWESQGGQDGSGSGVFAQVYDGPGSPRGTEFQVNTTTAGDQSQVAVAMSLSTFVATWRSPGADGTWDVFARVFDFDGNPITPEFQVNQSVYGNQQRVDVAMTDSGEFVITWQGVSPKFITSGEVYARAYDALGNPRGNEFIVPSTEELGHKNPSVALDAVGNAIIVWDGSGDTDNFGVHGRRFTNEFYDGGGIYNAANADVSVHNSIVAQNTASNEAPDVTGNFTSLGHNLIGDVGNSNVVGFTDSVNGDQVGDSVSGFAINPLLNGLADNGGTTPTHLPMSTSPVIDAGDNTNATSNDQRGVGRIIDGEPDGTSVIDIGAVEVNSIVNEFVVDVFTDSVDINLGDSLAEDAFG